MKLTAKGFLIAGLIMLFSAGYLVRDFSRSMRSNPERYVEVAYSRFFCGNNRWPASEGELLARADPDYKQSLENNEKIFDIKVVQQNTAGRALTLRFVGSYLGPFDDSVTLDASVFSCTEHTEGSTYFPGNRAPRVGLAK
jgi:hypothetical protein